MIFILIIGSACTSASLEPSYVLRALGVEEENAHSSIRFGIGIFKYINYYFFEKFLSKS